MIRSTGATLQGTRSAVAAPAGVPARGGRVRYWRAVRGVAQPGSALRSGRRGPQFESGHPDAGLEPVSPPVPREAHGRVVAVRPRVRRARAAAGGSRVAPSPRLPSTARALALAPPARARPAAARRHRRRRARDRRRAPRLGREHGRPTSPAVATPSLALGGVVALRIGCSRSPRAVLYVDRLEGRRAAAAQVGTDALIAWRCGHARLADRRDRAAPRAGRRHPRGGGRRRLPGARHRAGAGRRRTRSARRSPPPACRGCRRLVWGTARWAGATLYLGAPARRRASRSQRRGSCCGRRSGSARELFGARHARRAGASLFHVARHRFPAHRCRRGRARPSNELARGAPTAGTSRTQGGRDAWPRPGTRVTSSS